MNPFPEDGMPLTITLENLSLHTGLYLAALLIARPIALGTSSPTGVPPPPVRLASYRRSLSLSSLLSERMSTLFSARIASANNPAK